MAEDLFSIDTKPDVAIRKQIRKRHSKKDRAESAAIKERILARAVFGNSTDDVVDEADTLKPHGAGDTGAQAGTTFGIAHRRFNRDEEDDDDVMSDQDEQAEEDEENGEMEDENGAELGGVASNRDRAPQMQARQAAWVDEDDEEQVVSVVGGPKRLRKLRVSRAEQSVGGVDYVDRLRAQFASVQPDTAWATLGEDPIGAGADEKGWSVLSSSGALLGRSLSLGHSRLDVHRLPDLNVEEPSSSITPIVQWHPNAQLAFTAGPDQTVRLFRVDGHTNRKIQSVHLPQLPIESAAFSADGSQILICGRSKHWCARPCACISIPRPHPASAVRLPMMMCTFSTFGD